MMLADYKKADEDLRHALSLDKTNKFIKRCIKRNKKKQYNENQKNYMVECLINIMHF